MADVPHNARDLAQEVTRFCDAAAAVPAEYGTDAAELGTLRTLANDALAAESDKDAAQDAAKSKVTAADAAAKALEEAWRPVRRDAYNTADDEELREAGLEPRKERALTTPLAPTNLQVVAQADGTNRLFWKAGDAVDSTLYDIEAQVGNSPDFALVYTTGARKFDHKNQTPGQKIVYRVSARRRGISSPHSNLVQAY